MAKVKTINLYKEDRNTRAVLIDCKVDIKVSSSGVFYATLPDEQYLRLKAMNMLPKGYDIKQGMTAKTMSELETMIHESIQPLVEFKQVENKIVIKYLIQTACVYCKSTDGKYFPNAGGVYRNEDIITEPGGGFKFFDGTERRDQLSSGPYMMSIVVRFKRRITNEYKDGTQRTYYERVEYNDAELGANGKWLRELIGIRSDRYSSDDNLPEIEYNEKNALFFRKFVEGIFYVNDFVRQLNNSEMLEAVISKNKSLGFISEE